MVALTAGVGSVAHAVHYAVLVLGLLGLAALLLPWPSSPGTAGDEHAQRVAALRAQLAGESVPPAATTARASSARPVEGSAVVRLWHPLAVVSTMAAAGVHAAVGPAHWREGVVLGLFFAVAALTQVVGATVLALRPSATVLRIGVAGTASLLALWVVSRTTGVPFVPGGREAAGGWDLACVSWEVVAVVAGSVALRRPQEVLPPVVLPWRQWHAGVRMLAGAAVATLVVLSASGVGS